MRAFSVSMAAVIWLAGCDSFPYMNLDEPIVLVAEESFFAGCEKDPAKQAECRDFRFQQIEEAVAEWTMFFKEDTRPLVMVIDYTEEISSGSTNSLVHLRIEEGGCDNPAAWACYRKDYGEEPDLVFVTEDRIITLVAAHEFGHILGLGHYDNPEGVPSLMSASSPNGHAQSTDVDRVCQIHEECPAREIILEKREGSYLEGCKNCPID